MMFSWRIPYTMKRFWMVFVIAALLLSACGAEPEPTMSPADVQATAMAAAMTMVAETQAAVPTATPLPPTEPPTATPFPTNTVPPLSLETPTPATLAQTQAIGVLPTNTSAPASSGSNDPCNKPLTGYAGESANLKIANNTKPKGPLTISLYVNTLMGECGYLSSRFQTSGSMTVPLGHYTAWAIVDSTKPFTAGTTFSIMSPGNYQLDVQQESVILRAGCAPNC